MTKTLKLTEASDYIFFTSTTEDVHVRGLGGNDVLVGSDVGDTLMGGYGSDHLYGGKGGDYLVGNGETGDDRLGEDTLEGGEGDDTLLDGAVMKGGQGDDSYGVHAGHGYSCGASVEKANEGYDRVTATVWEGGHVFIGDHVEELRLSGLMWDETVTGERDNMIQAYGSDTANLIKSAAERHGMTLKIIAWGGDDTVSTAGTSDNVWGMDGNDSIATGGADDTLRGNEGDDTLDGGAGWDRMEGGDGNDVYRVEGSGDVVVEFAGQGTDSVVTTLGSYALAATLERLHYVGSGNFVGSGNEAANFLQSGNGADTLKAGGGQDTVYAWGGNDSVEAGAGHDLVFGWTGADRLQGDAGLDSLFGGEGADTLGGGTGNDRLEGDSGNDVLTGGAGADLLRGGTGADRFTWAATGESTALLRDRIEGFETGIDRIDLSAIDADAALAGNQAFVLEDAAAPHGRGDAWLVQVRGGVELRAETNGDGVADFVVLFTGGAPAGAADFIL